MADQSPDMSPRPWRRRRRQKSLVARDVAMPGYGNRGDDDRQDGWVSVAHYRCFRIDKCLDAVRPTTSYVKSHNSHLVLSLRYEVTFFCWKMCNFGIQNHDKRQLLIGTKDQG